MIYCDIALFFCALSTVIILRFGGAFIVKSKLNQYISSSGANVANVLDAFLFFFFPFNQFRFNKCLSFFFLSSLLFMFIFLSFSIFCLLSFYLMPFSFKLYSFFLSFFPVLIIFCFSFFLSLSILNYRFVFTFISNFSFSCHTLSASGHLSFS